jgi:hypothetical protein
VGPLAKRATELGRYRGAVVASASPQARAKSIATIIDYAFNGYSLGLRKKAAEWLLSNCNVKIVLDQGEITNATPTPANDIL